MRLVHVNFRFGFQPQWCLKKMNDSQIHLCLTYVPFLMKLKLRTAENLNQFKSKRKLICFSSCIFNLSVDCEIALFKVAGTSFLARGARHSLVTRERQNINSQNKYGGARLFSC